MTRLEVEAATLKKIEPAAKHVVQVDIKLKGDINAAAFLKAMIKGYQFDNVSDDWADGWCEAIKWSLDKIDKFFGVQ